MQQSDILNISTKINANDLIITFFQVEYFKHYADIEYFYNRTILIDILSANSRFFEIH